MAAWAYFSTWRRCRASAIRLVSANKLPCTFQRRLLWISPVPDLLHDMQRPALCTTN